MVKIQPFEVEQWMDTYETTPGVLNISETCAASISIDKLVLLNRLRTLAPPPVDFGRVMTYGAILGSDELRQSIAKTYHDPEAPAVAVAADDVIVTQGAIAANYLLFYTLVGPGDHVICVYPTYQQLYSVPESLGAEVELWKLRAENGFVPDVGELEGMIRGNTKMIVINNPNNPTGAIIPTDVLQKIASLARQHNIILFSDEVYRPLFHSITTTTNNTKTNTNTNSIQPPPPPPPPPSSALSLGYDRTIVTSSMSKAWALAGIRVGWLATRDPAIRQQVAAARDYTTISVSQVDDQIAAYALGDDVRPQLLARNLELARRNLGLLEKFVEELEDLGVCAWVRPQAGTTAFVRFFDRNGGMGMGGKQPVDDVAFCRDLLDKAKVMLVPGSRCFGNGNQSGRSGSEDAAAEDDFKGYVRFGYVSETEVLEQALLKLSAYVREHLV